MKVTEDFPDDVKKTFAFKLAIYILPGIILALLTALMIIPTPKPKEGLLQGHVSAPSPASSTLVLEPLTKGFVKREVTLSPGDDYHVSLPAGQYKLRLKNSSITSPQLPRTLTIVPNGSALFDIAIE